MRHAESLLGERQTETEKDRGLVGIAVPADDGFARAAVTAGNGSV